jgi:hypothetical protein
LPGYGFWPAAVCAFHIIRAHWWRGCDETDPEYELRFDAHEEYIRELIDRIDEMWLYGMKLCNRCTKKHPGKWEGRFGKVQCADCERNVERHFVLQKGAAVARRAGPLARR